MNSNPVLRTLGFEDTERVVIFHADDIGMCPATVRAYSDLLELGLTCSASVMVPCRSFREAASLCSEKERNVLDIGVHLTLTSEWDAYRWGPIGPLTEESGLTDADGHFHRTSECVQAMANPMEVRREIRAQVNRAFAAGMDISHIDSHMGSVFHPKFFWAYIGLACDLGIPALCLRTSRRGLCELGFQSFVASYLEKQGQWLEKVGLPMQDHLYHLSLDHSDDRLDQIKHALSSLQPGLTHFIFHPAIDTPELRSMAPDWRSRVADHRAFCSKELGMHVTHEGIHLIRYRDLREIMMRQRNERQVL